MDPDALYATVVVFMSWGTLMTIFLFFFFSKKNGIVSVPYLSLQLHSFTTADKTHYCVDPEAKWLKRRFQRLESVSVGDTFSGRNFTEI